MTNRLSVEDAAKIMGVSAQFIRIGLQQNKFKFGYAVKMSSQYTYFINRNLFEKEMGVKSGK